MTSADEIEAAKTAAGGWTKAQLALWGVPWPPPKGWKKALTEMSDGEGDGSEDDVSQVSRQEFNALKAKVDAQDRVIRRLNDSLRFVVDAAAERQSQHEEFMKRIAGHLGIEAETSAS